MSDDRTVHARCGELEIVRYDRAGKWWFEWNPPRMRAALRVDLDDAVVAASGGKMFDARVQKARAGSVSVSDPTPED